ncbi:MAG: 50S ribosomal protein L29 [Candidatus Lambdaproteobacteria bacterium]|nr:50S ribosomal protein L29 [Candidatus Lambdaproteobacteria bacterium]
MKSQDMRQLSLEELTAKVAGWEEERYRALCSKTIGQLQNTASLTDLRRNVARANTIINEKKRDAGSQS